MNILFYSNNNNFPLYFAEIYFNEAIIHAGFRKIRKMQHYMTHHKL